MLIVTVKIFMKALELGNGIRLKIVKNQYNVGNYRVSLLHPDTLSSASFGVGVGGSSAEGNLSEKEAIEVFEMIENNVNPDEFNFEDEEISELRNKVASLLKE